MKVHFIALVFLVFSKCLLAQTFEEPSDWATSNRYSIGNGAGPSVTRSASARTGLSAARLETKYSATLAQNIPGTITTGSISGTKAYGGQTYATRSQKLVGYYTYNPAGSDMAHVAVLLSKWNASTLKKDTIAFGHAALGSANIFKYFEVVLAYRSNAAPDSQLVIISSSQSPATVSAGSILVADDVSFTGTLVNTGTITRGKSQASLIYPNPASALFTLHTEEAIETLSIVNFEGAIIYSSAPFYSEQETKINAYLPVGLYLMQIFYRSGAFEVLRFVRSD